MSFKINDIVEYDNELFIYISQLKENISLKYILPKKEKTSLFNDFLFIKKTNENQIKLLTFKEANIILYNKILNNN